MLRYKFTTATKTSLVLLLNAEPTTENYRRKHGIVEITLTHIPLAETWRIHEEQEARRLLQKRARGGPGRKREEGLEDHKEEET